MSTTINPLMNSGPDDEGYGPQFPSSTGKGMRTQSRLLESRTHLNPKIPAKKFMKAAEGKKSGGKKKVKKGAKPENLRASEAKNRKAGAFGEIYKPPAGNTGKGVRVAGK